MKKITLCFMIAFLCMFCAKAQLSPENTDWCLRVFQGEEITEPYECTIHFNSQNGQTIGKAFCNRFIGEYSLQSNNRISCSGYATTFMVCGDASYYEYLFLTSLNQVNNYEVIGNRLFLYQDNELLMEFEAQGIENVLWYIHYLQGEEITADYEGTIYFNTETHQFEGTAFCNTYIGEYGLQSGNGITCAANTTTFMICNDFPNTMYYEYYFLQILPYINNYHLIDGSLLLFQDNELLMGFMKTPPVPIPEEPEIPVVSEYDYHYDNAGNRILREVIYLQSRGFTKSASGTKKEYSSEENQNMIERKTNDFELRIYPNPTKGLLNINISGEKEIQKTIVEVYNVNGKLIFSTSDFPNNYQINLSNQSKGIYFMRIVLNDLQYEWKIIKE